MKIKQTISKYTFSNNKGQSFIEFLFLLIILIGMSFVLIRTVNSRIADRWVNIIAVIVSPNPNEPRKPELR